MSRFLAMATDDATPASRCFSSFTLEPTFAKALAFGLSFALGLALKSRACPGDVAETTASIATTFAKCVNLLGAGMLKGLFIIVLAVAFCHPTAVHLVAPILGCRLDQKHYLIVYFFVRC